MKVTIIISKTLASLLTAIVLCTPVVSGNEIASETDVLTATTTATEEILYDKEGLALDRYGNPTLCCAPLPPEENEDLCCAPLFRTDEEIAQLVNSLLAASKETATE